MSFDAACTVILHPSNPGLVLGVSRGLGSRRFGLPGGHRERGEEAAQTAARELWEETGLRCHLFVPLHAGFADDGAFAVTFLCPKWSGKMKASSPEGVVEWVNWWELLAGPFGNINRQIYNQLCRMEQGQRA